MNGGLRGFVAQGMDGRKAQPVGFSASFPVGTMSWIVPETATYLFAMWGAGAGGNNTTVLGGGSGAFVLARRRLIAGQVVTVTVGQGGRTNTTPAGFDGGDTTVTLPNGEVLTAGGGKTAGGAGGTATANSSTFRDISFSGSTGGAAGSAGAAGLGGAGGAGGAGAGPSSGGAGAPGYGPYRGGAGAPAATSAVAGFAPGGGGATDSNIGTRGGDGLVVATKA